MDKLNCLRCGGAMRAVKREYLQLGRTGWIMGDLNNLIAGGLDVVIWACPGCGKLEFFSAGELEEDPELEESGIAQVKCPRCGREHDMDDPRCPHCGERNPNW